jgi:hypothetical protein
MGENGKKEKEAHMENDADRTRKQNAKWEREAITVTWKTKRTWRGTGGKKRKGEKEKETDKESDRRG